jgi:hypothetical protein
MNGVFWLTTPNKWEDLLEFSCEETPFLSDTEMSLLEKVVVVVELGENYSG